MGDCVVYWLFDETCVCPQRHGYIGISNNLKRRLWRHRRSERFPEFNVMIIGKGAVDECRKIEWALRPQINIGWNIATGGFSSAHMSTAIANKKKSDALKARWRNDPDFRRRVSDSQFGKYDRGGAKNHRFGKALSEGVRQNISQARAGKGIGNQNWKRRKPYSAEALRKMSEASKRRWRTENANLV
jgi:hypothetical protein